MKRATQQALSVPAFRTPADCTPWVLGGLWPTELSAITPETATLAEYLRNDLQRIAKSANEKLRVISESGLEGQARQAEESRVVNVARAFAVLRVESTVRQLRNEAIGFHAEYLSLSPAPPRAQPKSEPALAAREPVFVAPAAVESDTDAARVAETDPELPVAVPAPKPAAPVQSWPVVEPEAAVPPAEPAAAVPPAEPDRPVVERVVEPRAPRFFESSYATPEQAEADVPDVLEPAPGRPAFFAREPVLIEPVGEPTTIERPPMRPASPPPPEPESADELIRRILQTLARQEPGMRWAVADREDGSVVVATDLAFGWIPPGIGLPADVELLAPARHTGNPAAMIAAAGGVITSVSYAPGDHFGGFGGPAAATPSSQARDLPAVDDMGWKLGEVTHWRDGLPRLAHTLAKAAAAGTGVVEAELDVLRVHLDTARYQLMATYPDVDVDVLLNCQLLAATDALASGDKVSANYHFSWFETLSVKPASQWGVDR